MTCLLPILLLRFRTSILDSPNLYVSICMLALTSDGAPWVTNGYARVRMTLKADARRSSWGPTVPPSFDLPNLFCECRSHGCTPVQCQQISISSAVGVFRPSNSASFALLPTYPTIPQHKNTPLFLALPHFFTLALHTFLQHDGLRAAQQRLRRPTALQSYTSYFAVW